MGALLLSGEVGEQSGAVSQSRVPRCWNLVTVAVSMRELFVERVIPHGEQDGKAGGVEVVPVGDVGVVEPVQCMEAPDPRGGRWWKRRRRKAWTRQERFGFLDEGAGRVSVKNWSV